MADTAYCTEYSKNARSKCADAKCKGSLEKGVLRIGKMTKSSGDSESEKSTKWYHAECIFGALSRARANTKKIESTGDIEGFGDLKQEDQDTITKLVDEFKSGAMKKTTTRKRKKADDDDDGEEKKRKRKAASKKRSSRKKKKNSDDEDDEEEEEEEEEDEPEEDDQGDDEEEEKKQKKRATKKKKEEDDDPTVEEGPAESVMLQAESNAGGKFWECKLKGRKIITRFGKLNSKGQEKSKVLKDIATAKKEYDKNVAKKKTEGYSAPGDEEAEDADNGDDAEDAEDAEDEE